MPVQGVSSVSSGVAAEFFAAAATRINSTVAARGDAVLQSTPNTPDVHAPQVGPAQTPINFSGNIVDFRA